MRKKTLTELNQSSIQRMIDEGHRAEVAGKDVHDTLIEKFGENRVRLFVHIFECPKIDLQEIRKVLLWDDNTVEYSIKRR